MHLRSIRLTQVEGVKWSATHAAHLAHLALLDFLQQRIVLRHVVGVMPRLQQSPLGSRQPSVGLRRRRCRRRGSSLLLAAGLAAALHVSSRGRRSGSTRQCLLPLLLTLLVCKLRGAGTRPSASHVALGMRLHLLPDAAVARRIRQIKREESLPVRCRTPPQRCCSSDPDLLVDWRRGDVSGGLLVVRSGACAGW